jgi:hypothetical protein
MKPSSFAVAGAVLLFMVLGMPDSWLGSRKSGYKSIAARSRRV